MGYHEQQRIHSDKARAESSMDPIQREKIRIQKREQRAITAFSLFALGAFLVPSILLISLARSPVVLMDFPCLPPLFFLLFFFLIFGLGISQLGPYLQKIQRQKKRWLNEYGQHVHAVMSQHPAENALIIGERLRGRNASHARYLHWQDPQTAQLYSFPVSVRFSSALRNLPEGTLCPVHFDPDDLSFFVVPGK